MIYVYMYIYIVYIYISARIDNSSNLLNVLAKGSISDVSRGVELAFAIFFMVTLSDPEVFFKRCSLFSEFRP